MTVFEVGDRVRLSDGEEAEVSAVGNDWAEIRYDDGFYGVKLISDLQSVAESLSPDEEAKAVLVTARGWMDEQWREVRPAVDIPGTRAHYDAVRAYLNAMGKGT